MISTALPMRAFDREAGVLDLWHIPFQWIDLIWQRVASQQRSAGKAGTLDPKSLRSMLGQTGEEYGTQLARFAEDAAQRWHGVQICSFHPCYVASPQPYLGSSQQALEMGLEGARAAGCRFENLERWSRFFRARADVRLTEWCTEKSAEFITLESATSIDGLTLLLPDRVAGVRSKGTGEEFPVREVILEGRTQRVVVIELRTDSPLTLCFTSL